jgi:hypothetical protein
MLRRQGEFRVAADAVTAVLAGFAEVEKVALIGSVARPLWREVPRFAPFRQLGVRIWHECKDVDLAVWLDDLGSLRLLNRARSLALRRLFEETQIGVAHHQVDVFILRGGSDDYLGRLCIFGECPKGKSECEVPGCGREAFPPAARGLHLLAVDAGRGPNHAALRPKLGRQAVRSGHPGRRMGSGRWREIVSDGLEMASRVNPRCQLPLACRRVRSRQLKHRAAARGKSRRGRTAPRRTARRRAWRGCR